MPIRSLRRTTGLLLVLCCATVAHAWAPRTRIAMLDEAIRFMPASLRLALETHRNDVRRGLLEAQLGEDGPDHRPAAGEHAGLERSIETSARRLIAAIENGASFSVIAHRFGTFAHFVQDAGFPPGVSTDGDGRYGHFSALVENRREKIPLVFFGHEDGALDGSPDFGAFARALVAQSLEDDRRLRARYADAGSPPDPRHFDDRSVPFAIASLSYSRSVTHVVRGWIACWREAGGDVARTPYLEPPGGSKP